MTHVDLTRKFKCGQRVTRENVTYWIIDVDYSVSLATLTSIKSNLTSSHWYTFAFLKPFPKVRRR